MLGTDQIHSLQPEFVITGLKNTVNMDLGLKKLKKYACYNRKFVMTEFFITEFHFNWVSQWFNSFLKVLGVRGKTFVNLWYTFAIHWF
jgi:hypothetical protein